MGDYLGSPILSQTECSVLYTSLCLNPLKHTIIMHDQYGDGWDDGSFLVLSNNNNSISFSINFLNTFSKQIFNSETLELITPTPLLPNTVAPTTQTPKEKCEEGQIMVELDRHCGLWPGEESIDIYEGTGTNLGSPLYTQLECTNVETYLCMNPVKYTIMLHDSYGDGWSIGSSLYMSHDGYVLYLVLESSYNSTHVINAETLLHDLPPPPECDVGKNAVEYIRQCGSHSNEESLEIYEGSRDNLGNLIYNETSCIWHSTQLCMNLGEHTLIIKDSYGDGWDQFSIIAFRNSEIGSLTDTSLVKNIFYFSLVIHPTSIDIIPLPDIGCENGKAVVQLERTCGNSIQNEALVIYKYNEGEITERVYCQGECREVNISLCLNPVDNYILILYSPNYGWSSNSSIILSSNETSTSYSMSDGRNADVIEFNPLFLDRPQ